MSTATSLASEVMTEVTKDIRDICFAKPENSAVVEIAGEVKAMLPQTSSDEESPEYLSPQSLAATRSKGMKTGVQFVSRLPSPEGFPEFAVLDKLVVGRLQQVPVIPRGCTILVGGAYDPLSGASALTCTRGVSADFGGWPKNPCWISFIADVNSMLPEGMSAMGSICALDLFGSCAAGKDMDGKDTNVLRLRDTDGGKAYLQIRIGAWAEWLSMPGTENIKIALLWGKSMNDAKIRVPLLDAVNKSRAEAHMQPIECISFINGTYVPHPMSLVGKFFMRIKPEVIKISSDSYDEVVKTWAGMVGISEDDLELGGLQRRYERTGTPEQRKAAQEVSRLAGEQNIKRGGGFNGESGNDASDAVKKSQRYKKAEKDGLTGGQLNEFMTQVAAMEGIDVLEFGFTADDVVEAYAVARGWGPHTFPYELSKPLLERVTYTLSLGNKARASEETARFFHMKQEGDGSRVQAVYGLGRRPLGFKPLGWFSATPDKLDEVASQLPSAFTSKEFRDKVAYLFPGRPPSVDKQKLNKKMAEHAKAKSVGFRLQEKGTRHKEAQWVKGEKKRRRPSASDSDFE